MESLKGKLLVSGGAMSDPNFRHTVVLVGEHDVWGAVGVILSRPMETKVVEAAPPLAGLVAPGDPLFEGGPVEPEQPVLLAEVRDTELLDVPVVGSVGFLTGDVPSDFDRQIQRARVFAGHAGWGAGQLEAEIESGSWILDPAREEDIFTSAPETLWRRVLQRKGPEYATLARVPFDPSMN